MEELKAVEVPNELSPNGAPSPDVTAHAMQSLEDLLHRPR